MEITFYQIKFKVLVMEITILCKLNFPKIQIKSWSWN